MGYVYDANVKALCEKSKNPHAYVKRKCRLLVCFYAEYCQ